MDRRRSSIAGRALLAVCLMIAFYLKAIGIAGTLLAVPFDGKPISRPARFGVVYRHRDGHWHPHRARKNLRVFHDAIPAPLAD